MFFLFCSGGILDCTAYGVPPPKITWLRYDPGLETPPLTELTFSSNYGSSNAGPPGLSNAALWQILAHNNSLKFRSFSASDYNPTVHKAAYVCRASSESGIILSRIVNVKSGEKKLKVCKYWHKSEIAVGLSIKTVHWITVIENLQKMSNFRFLFRIFLVWIFGTKIPIVWLETNLGLPCSEMRLFECIFKHCDGWRVSSCLMDVLLPHNSCRPLSLTALTKANSLDWNKKKKGNWWSICGGSSALYLYISAICRCKIQARS